jgi:gas vesicle protein
MTNGKKIVTAFILGTAAGALMGVLFAPARGEETREKIRKKGKELKGEFEDGWREGNRKIQEVQNSLQRVLDEVDAKAEVIREKLKKYT